ncbi:hypothetical protein M5K25_010173 [Dendrobium thyrsiflorum]|uniref:Uncharacterized protein n=1 Tax=Dendrobium thyrsiflorum TaxID=117978 RepID=A0ABD0UZP6_DENTH
MVTSSLETLRGTEIPATTVGIVIQETEAALAAWKPARKLQKEEGFPSVREREHRLARSLARGYA